MMLALIVIGALGVPLLFGAWQIARERRIKKRQLTLAKAVERLVFHHKLTIENSETLGNRIIALDTKNRQLLFIDHNNTAPLEICIPLLHIEHAEMVEERNGEGSISRIILVLQSKCSKKYAMCFFDDACDPIIEFPNLIRRAQHWKITIERSKRQIVDAAKQGYKRVGLI